MGICIVVPTCTCEVLTINTTLNVHLKHIKWHQQPEKEVYGSKETYYPHFVYLPKDVNDEAYAHMHLVGVLYNIFLTYPNMLAF